MSSVLPSDFEQLSELERIASGPFSAIQAGVPCPANGFRCGQPIEIDTKSGLSSARCPIRVSYSIEFAHRDSFTDFEAKAQWEASEQGRAHLALIAARKAGR